MKKILFVASITGHINGFHIPYLKMFKENGYEVHVASKGKEKIEYCDKHFEIPFERSPFKLKNIGVYKELKKIINQNDYEIIHCNTPVASVLTRLATKKARKKGTRVIYTAHGFHFFKGASIKNWLIFYPVEWYLAKYTDTLITINEEDYERAKKGFRKRCKDIQHVHGVGLDTTKFDIEITEEEQDKIRKEIGISKDNIVLSYVAELNKNKNQIMLIKAVQELVKENEKYRLILVGDGPLKKYLEEYVAQNQLNEYIKFLGKRYDIPQILKITNIYVASSLREGLPVNILEAQYMKLPVVAMDNRGHRELVEENIVKDIREMRERISNQYDCKIYRKNNVNNYLLDNVKKEMWEIYNKKKKILHVLASNSFSGAENVVCTIIENMIEEYDMAYCSPEGTIAEILKGKNIKYFSIKKLSICEIKYIIEKFNPDIIHAHDFRAGLICSVLKKKKSLIIHIHNNSPWLKRINIRSFLFLYMSLKSNKILIVSNSIKNEYIFSNIIEYKIITIGNPVSRKNILDRVEDLRVDKKYDICCTARISKTKNPMKFLDIIKEVKKEFPNIRSIWIGDGEMRDIFKNKIKEMELEENIEVAGFQKNPYKYMVQSKLFLLTSDWEGFGLVVFEALTLGLPCIVSNVGGLPGIIDEKCGKLCNIDSINNYVEVIEKLLKDEEKFTIFSKEAINKSKKLENISEYMLNLSKIYNEEN